MAKTIQEAVEPDPAKRITMSKFLERLEMGVGSFEVEADKNLRFKSGSSRAGVSWANFFQKTKKAPMTLRASVPSGPEWTRTTDLTLIRVALTS